MLQTNWKSFIIGIGVFIFILTLFFGGGNNYWNAVALAGIMIFFWVFEVIPIYLTALFPVIFAIPLGVLEKDDLAACYGNSNVFLFFGGFVAALGLEKWGVHEQIAKRIIRFVGTKKKNILLGFILSTGFLSMWISNTATALMMLPIAIAIVSINHEKGSKFPLLLMLSVASAASIGGLGTLVGSPPNTQMASILDSNFNTHVSFVDWLKIGMPLSFIILAANYFLFNLLLGKERNESIHGFELKEENWTSDQIKVSIIFGIVIVLWIFKDLIAPLIHFNYGDETAAVIGALLLFVIPSTNKKTLLEWKDTEKLPWGILLLFGGGLALAEILEANGIIEQISASLIQYTNLPVFWILFALVFVAIFASEVLSNLALVTVMVPVIAKFAIDAHLPVLPVCMALTFGASCAFMLPVGTPPNAIVFSSGYIHMNQMVKIGFAMNMISLVLIVLFSMLFM